MYMNMKWLIYPLPLAVAFALVAGCGQSGETEERTHPLEEKPAFRDLNGNGVMEVYEDESLPVSRRVDDLLGRLDTEQKIRLVMGTGMDLEDYTNPDSRVPGAAGYTYPLENLGVSSIALADGPAGLRIVPQRKGDSGTYYATAFPIETVLSSTWDVDVLDKVGRAMGEEVKEYGVDILLAPGMNIHRNPLGGRNFEYYSEDPYLSGKMAAAMVEGVESRGVGATLKHYVANNQETNRFLVDTLVGERALREIYLRGFEIAVREAQPWAIMSAYNKVNGTYATQHESLLTTVLRGEWGFEGLVMTDWFAGDDAVVQMEAGSDLIMPGTDKDLESLRKGLESGRLAEATLDGNLRRILTAVFRSRSFAGYPYSDKPDLKAHAQVARQAAAEGIVLLKNDGGALPLGDAVRDIAVFGNISYDFLAGGTGSGDVNEAYTVSLVQALEANGYRVDEALAAVYKDFIAEEKAKQPEKENFFDALPPIPEMPVDGALLKSKARDADVALITIGRNSGEGGDRAVQADFNLTGNERKMIDQVANAFRGEGKKVVVILNIGNVIETASWRDKADAIVLPWQGGQEAGNAVLDVLTGKVNPSGKLPTTFPVQYSDVPSSDNFPGEKTSEEVFVGLGGFAKGNPSKVEYEEGIYIGYRYYDTFDVATAYPFGYGLSYTDFQYGAVELSAETFEGQISATVDVTNSGKAPGREVVQLYLGAPRDGLHKPEKELKGFAKTRELAPGESQRLTFPLQPRDLASFDGRRSAWLAAAGSYTVQIGASSEDIRSTATFGLADELVVEKVAAELSPAGKINELEPR